MRRPPAALFPLSERLRAVRKKAGITQAQVAQHIGINKRNYIRYEMGETLPTIDKMIAMADFYNTSIDYLLGRSLNDLQEDERAIIAAYRKIPTDKRGNALKILQALE